KKWSGNDLSKAKDLQAALSEYEELAGLPAISRPARYFSFRQCLNVNDEEANRALALISKRLRKASDQILFFTLKLGKLSDEKKREYLNDPSLAHFRYYLERIFEGAKHDLSEAEEKIIRLKARPASGMWQDAVEKIISNRKIKFKGKEL